MLSTSRAACAVTVFAILSVLTACGGGGGSGAPPPPPPPPPAATYTVTATVTGLAGSGLTLLDNGGDSKAVTADGAVTFATVLANAAPYAVTVGTQPTSPIQSCTVTNSSGTIAGANVANVAVACATQNPRVAYSLNYYGGSSNAYVTDAATGQLRLRSVIKVGNTPITFYGDRAGKFLFFLNQGTAQSPLALPPIPQTSSSLSAFTLNATGDAREVAGSPYPISSGLPAATGLTALPGDGFLYVTNSTLNNIEGFAVSATGTLTSVGSPFATGAGPNPVTFDPAGHFAYVSNQTSSSVFIYSVNATTGALTEIQADRVATGVSPSAVFLTTDGKFAYVANAPASMSALAPASISAFAVNSSSGALTPVAGSPFPVPPVVGVGSNPPILSVMFNPNGKRCISKTMAAREQVRWPRSPSIPQRAHSHRLAAALSLWGSARRAWRD